MNEKSKGRAGSHKQTHGTEHGPGHPLIIGAHLSISKGIHRALYDAVALGCNTVQVFTKNASTWKEKEITGKQAADMAEAREKTGVNPVFSHCSYLINIAGGDAEKTEMSVSALHRELIRCDKLGIGYLVLHPGSHMGDGEEKGIKRVAANLDRAFERAGTVRTMILLETTAGQGHSLGHRFEQLAAMRDLCAGSENIGFCLDTCHIFAAGYDLASDEGYEHTLKAFDRIIGLTRLRLLHLNDVKKPCGSRVDRHEHIGEGYIGDAGFRRIMNDRRLAGIPRIIETPKEKDGQDADPINIARLRALVA